jgi:hypothetical protein
MTPNHGIAANDIGFTIANDLAGFPAGFALAGAGALLIAGLPRPPTS